MSTGPLELLARLGTHAGIVLMRLLAPLPLPWVRRLGVCLGYVLYALALQSGAALLPVRLLRLPRGAGYEMEILPPLTDLNTTPPPDLLQAVTLVNQCIESLILSQPGHYLWAYARYKKPRGAPATTAESPANNGKEST